MGQEGRGRRPGKAGPSRGQRLGDRRPKVEAVAQARPAPRVRSPGPGPGSDAQVEARPAQKTLLKFVFLAKFGAAGGFARNHGQAPPFSKPPFGGDPRRFAAGGFGEAGRVLRLEVAVGLEFTPCQRARARAAHSRSGGLW